MKKLLLLFAGFAFLIFNVPAQTVIDIDGNVYNTVTIGTQVWMKENLKVTHYSNGDPIPNVVDSSTWVNLTTGARCYYNNDSANNASVYGALYNWYTVNDSNLCPAGWHVASDGEWNILEKYLDNTFDTSSCGYIGYFGGKLKETDTTHWESPNIGATNSSGFTALPGGLRYNVDGTYTSVRGRGFWWTATTTTNSVFHAYGRILNHQDTMIICGGFIKRSGFSVRCLKDFSSSQLNENNTDKNIQIYPNPATDKIFINISDAQKLKMQIYNVVGDCVLQGDFNEGVNEIDVSGFAKGIYFVKLNANEFSSITKMIKY